MHTRGILVMTPDSAMVLTGKQALDYSGGVSAEDNFGIGGFDRIMGPNGQAQYWAPHLAGACEVLLAHYAHSLHRAGRASPRRADDGRPDRSRRARLPHSAPGHDFTTVGDIFSAVTNPERKKPFDIRVGDARRRSTRTTRRSSGGPRWRTLRPPSSTTPTSAAFRSRCSASSRGRCPGAASCPRTAPTSGRPGRCSPCRRRRWPVRSTPRAATGRWWCWPISRASTARRSRCANCQLEYGAEIGRAVVNFDGPIVFCVVSRYHGGAFVVFSGALNDDMEVLAVEGSFASVIGGAPAAAVVFAGDVDARTEADPRVARGREPRWRARRTRTAAGCGPSSATCARRCAPRSSARSPRSSTRSTASSEPWRSDRWMPSSQRTDSARASSRR